MLLYREYVGDGDPPSLIEVVNAKPYDKVCITTIGLECIGYIPKLLGNRLQKFQSKQAAVLFGWNSCSITPPDQKSYEINQDPYKIFL